MAKKSTPTQVSYRNSGSGRFITKPQADRNPRGTEREVIKHPERKK
jgi:hypothetical protein